MRMRLGPRRGGAPRTGRPALLILVALAMVLAGTGLRLYGLEHKVVWHDEVFTLARVLGYGHQEVLDGVHNDRLQTPDELLRFQRQAPDRGFADAWRALQEHPEHGPIYYLLAIAATHLVAPPLAAVRLTSALLSLLLLPALFWLAREWDGPGRTPWVVMALAAVSPLHLLYAQEARQYALLSLLIAAASAALLAALRRGRRKDWALYGLLLTLGLYTHLLFILVMVAHVLYLLWSRRAQPEIWPGALGHTAGSFAFALAAFAPWLLVMARGMGALTGFTGWMARPAGPGELTHSWLGHLNRLFVDLGPMEPWWPLGALLVGLLLVHALACSTAPARRFLVTLLLPPLLVTVLPDLVLGGVRSGETRYLLQALITLELAVAWSLVRWLGMGITWLRRGAAGVLTGVLLLGLASGWVIDRADTSWSKSFSAENAAFAQVVNATKRPLVLGCPSFISAGEMISLSYLLGPQVRLLGIRKEREIPIPRGYSDLFLLLPYARLRAELAAQGYRIRPFQHSWKWFRALPEGRPGGHEGRALTGAAPQTHSP
jgi:uncharacterized membrane protein